MVMTRLDPVRRGKSSANQPRRSGRAYATRALRHLCVGILGHLDPWIHAVSLKAPARPGLSLCAEYERQLGGGSPLSSLMARRISEAQGCHREMGSEESAEQSRGSMDKNRAPPHSSRGIVYP